MATRFRLLRSVVAPLVALVIAAATPDSIPVVTAASTPPTTAPVVVPYVPGQSISWIGQVLPLDGAEPYPGPAGGVGYQGGSLIGLGGGAAGIVAAGYDANVGTWATWVSKDRGATWTERPTTPFLAGIVARRGVFATYAAGLRSSTDGSTWTLPRPSIGGSTGVVGSGLVGFVALSHGSETRAWYSSDGMTWHLSPYTAPLRGFCPTAIASGPSVAVAIGSVCGIGAMRLFVTSDGRWWRSIPVPTGIRYGATISYVSGRFLIIGPYGTYPADGTAVWISTNGTSWTRRSYVRRLGVSPDVVGSVVRFGLGWVAVGYGNADGGDCSLRAWKTPDLVHWTRMILPYAGYSGGYCDKAIQAVVTGGRLVVAGYTTGPDPTAPLIWIGELVASP